MMTPENTKTSPIAQAELLLSLGLMGVLVVLIIPLPTMLLDAFLAANLSISILILLIVLNIQKPLEISVFPSLLLLLTLARLSLNVATTRLILLHSDAGKIVSTFGGFVVGGNIVVGLVIFLILVIIQFIVITKGASRVSEVAARFTLDALPGKQMAIDAELSSGNIDEETARTRREQLSMETEFYGSMDGAGKFVRGDAIAGLVITVINLLGGAVVGLSKGMSLPDAIQTFSTLTIGDGLVSQIPALIIATTAGILVTKATTSNSLGKEIGEQVTRYSAPLLAGAIILGSLAIVPGLPKIPFLVLSATLLFLWQKQRTGSKNQGQVEETDANDPEATDSFHKHFEDFVQTDQACLEVGVALISMLEPDSKKGIVRRISELRSDLTRKHGIWVPAVRVRDNIRIAPNSYRIVINGREVSSGIIETDMLLAIDPGTTSGPIDGQEAKDPAFGLPAKWIGENLRSRATRLGYTVVDVTTVIITHLGETLKRFAPELMSREDLAQLIAELRKTEPSLVDDIKPDTIRVSDIHQVMKWLLAERVPVSNFARIIEAVLYHAPRTKDPIELADLVRTSIGTEILEPFHDPNRVVHAIVCEPALESAFRDTLSNQVLAIDPVALENFCTLLNDHRQRSLAEDRELVLLVESALRRPIRNAIERAMPELAVVSYSEVPRDVHVEFKSVVRQDQVFSTSDHQNQTQPQTMGAA